ncbi:hypothetical protein NKR19_g6994 [Coniochaeta hoffmannii]|uniref:Uncharacterized protein n=1 Tax=Coniochaeta hoffmannii TaxID=91930 RepID=A0AA38RCV1_9PEZI|nr:hypothetical protein NKR19_g6994 [Coniochaeta hoffmannii]
MDVSSLVSQMHETLSTIHSTLASLDTKSHDARLDELERERETALAALRKNFEQQAEALAQKRRAELDEIAERRRKEDEERERRRRHEDEEIAERARREDREHQLKLEQETGNVEEETDGLMNEVEEDATRLLEEGRERLRVLEERRREINRLIDEQLKAPLPSAPSRRRTMRSSSAALAPVVAAESKISVPDTADEQIGNTGDKAPDVADQPTEHGPQDGLDNGLACETLLEEPCSRPADGAALHGDASTTVETTSRTALSSQMAEDDEDVVATQRTLSDTDYKADHETVDGSAHDVCYHSNSVSGSGSPRGLQLDSHQPLEPPPTGMNPNPSPEGASRNGTLAEEPDVDGDDANAVTGKALQPPSPEFSDDHFEMTGHEPIPGTMTHGVDKPLGINNSEDAVSDAADILQVSAVIPVCSSHGSGDRVETPAVSRPFEGVLGTTADNQAVLDGSKLHDDQLDAVLQRAASPERDTPPSHLTLSISEEGGEELPALTVGASDYLAPNDDRLSSSEEISAAPVEDLYQPSREDAAHQDRHASPGQSSDLDVADEEGSLGEDDNADASSQNGSIEAESSANTSIASVLPASLQTSATEKGVYLDHGTDNVSGQPGAEPIPSFEHVDRGTSFEATASTDASVHGEPEAPDRANTLGEGPEGDYEPHEKMPVPVADAGMSEADADAEVEVDSVSVDFNATAGDGSRRLTVEDALVGLCNSGVSQEHTDVDSNSGEPDDFDDSSFPEHHLRPFRDDGDPADHHYHGKDNDDQILVSNGRLPSTSYTAQLDPNTGGTAFIPGHSKPDTESQSFMTPLASADFHTPMQFQDWPVSQEYDPDQLDEDGRQYPTEDQLAVTMHGQDDLFDDDAHSDEASLDSTAKHDAESADEDRQEDHSGSQSTLSSSPSSPIHSSVPVDNHEPVIRDSWPTPTQDRLLLSGMGRPRNDSQLSSNADFDPFRYEAKAAAAQWQQREPAGSHGPGSNGRTTPHRNSVASSSPSGLFQKMRSIFEPAGGGTTANRSLPSSGRNSPVWTRATSGAPHPGFRRPSGPPQSPTRHASGNVTRDGDGYDSASDRRGGGFLAETAADDETDERSSLLNNTYDEGTEVN